MARVALPKMTPTAEGGWTARKRIPADVQDAYEKVYRVRWEERFNSGPVPFSLAREKLAGWANDIDGSATSAPSARVAGVH